MEQSVYGSESYPENQFSSLHLNNTINSPPRSISDLPQFSPCLNCISFKKRSPPSDLPNSSQPQSKKIKEYRLPENPYGVSPISVVKLPPDSIPATSPFLRRSYSDPYNNPGGPRNDDSSMNPYDECNINNPVLRRTSSDPIPPTYLNSGTDEGLLSRCNSGLESIKEASPNSKRLLRMKDRMREMNRWLGEVIREDKDDPKDENVMVQGANLESGEADEEVSVERVGECLSINFKCPCGKVCQILLSGKHCYFKMI